MKRILIIYPHWPPSNLVGVHRVRLIANEMSDLGWNCTVLTVDERDYEEPGSPDSIQLIASEVEVIKVRAHSVQTLFGRRLIGDIGMRGWHALRKGAQEILSKGETDFVWFSIPSWYPSLMGTGLSKRFNVPFGIDYQDPWVYSLADHEKGLNRAFLTVTMARLLEPIALRRVRLISGISDGYLSGVRKRYSKLAKLPIVPCQLGFSPRDHEIELPHFQPPFSQGKRTFVYAGAYWAQGAPLFRLFLEALQDLNQAKRLPEDIEFLFIGTGNSALLSLTEQAKDLNLGGVFREIPERMPYLEVQQILREADGALVMGSIEAHYSASKIFQCLIAAKRTFAFFHKQSEGADILKACKADDFFTPFDPDWTAEKQHHILAEKLLAFTNATSDWNPDLQPLEKHSAKHSAQLLIQGIESIA